jgi:hypothetical protein
MSLQGPVISRGNLPVRKCDYHRSQPAPAEYLFATGNLDGMQVKVIWLCGACIRHLEGEHSYWEPQAGSSSATLFRFDEHMARKL